MTNEEYKSMSDEELKAYEDKKYFKMLESTYEMYENNKAEVIKKHSTTLNSDGSRRYPEEETKKALRMFEGMQQDILDEYARRGGNIEELKERVANKKKGIKRPDIKEIMNMKPSNIDNKKMEDLGEALEDLHRSLNKTNTNNKQVENSVSNTKKEDTFFKTVKEHIPTNTVFDHVPLPSNGEGYKCKVDKLPVSFLTAFDENMIVSPNLYRDGTFLDYIISNKLMSDKIKPDDLLVGDRDAIILFLRTSSYGPLFPVTATDGETGKQFETVVDLTQLKYKEFNLKGDENGYFDFELPISKDKIKFRFLTIGDLRRIDKFEEQERLGLKKVKIGKVVSDLTDILEFDNIEPIDKKKVSECINTLDKVNNSINANSAYFSHTITNKLILSIMAVNDITDRNYIEDYVYKMNVRDSSALRKYISENEPGIDFNITVERPESLGGGSIRMFLTLDQFIFLNII